MQSNSIKDLVKEILQKTEIEKVVSAHVDLQKRGNNYLGLCPFHQDKNPSFTISPQKKIFKCFSCGSSGNVISFVQNFKGISFIEALKELATLNNINYSSVIKEVPRKIDPEFDKYVNLNNEARDLFKYNLKQEILDENSQVAKYLKERNLGEKEINEFNIGYAKNNSTDFLVRKGIESELLVKYGFTKSANGKSYDFFNNRIMFPISNDYGQTIGFSGRVIGAEGNYAKYLNSQENDYFKKGSVLYNFHNAKSGISLRNSIIIVEGYMDVIAFNKIGYKNTVATMGVSLSDFNIKKISNLTKNIVLCFDSDAAGINATTKIGLLFLKHKLNVKVIDLSGKKDIDELLKNIDIDKANELVSNPKTFNEFLIDSFIKTFKDKPDFSKLVSVLKVIKSNSSLIELDHFINVIAKHYSLTKEIIFKELNIDIVSQDKPKGNIKSIVEQFSNNSNIEDFINQRIDDDFELTKDFEYLKSKETKANSAKLSEKLNELLLLSYSISSKEAFEFLIAQHYIFNDELIRKLFVAYRNYLLSGEQLIITQELEHTNEQVQLTIHAEKDIEVIKNKIKSIASKLKFNKNLYSKKKAVTDMKKAPYNEKLEHINYLLKTK